MKLWIAFGLLLCTAAMGDELGRLFTTAEQRARLQQLRASESGGQGVVETPAKSIAMQGLIVNQQGKAFVFVGGHPLTMGEADGEVKLLKADKTGALLQRRKGGDLSTLKPGQTWSGSGQVHEEFPETAPAREPLP